MTDRTPHVPASVASLAPFVAAGTFGPTDVQLAATIARSRPDLHPHVTLALAVASSAPRLGHVGIELAEVPRRLIDGREDGVDLPWPTTRAWADALVASEVVADPDTADLAPRRPLVWDGTRIYLQRYFAYEVRVAAELLRRSRTPPRPWGTGVDAALDALFPEGGLQRTAAASALAESVAVIAGGPGTGKTRTIARLVAAARQVAAAEGRTIELALAAPTGKAASRMTEAVHQAVTEAQAEGVLDAALAERLHAEEATTIHRLLGAAPGGRFRHHALNPLVHDLVVVDETSMVSLPLMARLLDALRPDAALVLVGDPDQLASVEAGTVLADVVGPVGAPAPEGTLALEPVVSGPLAGQVTVLQRRHRFSGSSDIAALADAIRAGHVEESLALLGGGSTELTWVDPADATAVAAVEGDVVAAASAVVRAAQSGDAAGALAAASQVKVLTATRHGANSRADWTGRIDAALAATIEAYGGGRGRWHAGRPVLVTVNDPVNRVANGDVGVAVAMVGGLTVALAEGAEVRYVPPARLREVETWWAMTIHKSQGSEFPHVVVALPELGSPILTRELLYTAITRAKAHVTVVAGEAALRAAIARPIARASGLGPRLWPL